MRLPLIAPSLLSSDFSRLAETIEMINRSDAAWIHLDVMDGHFVPNITFGPPVIRDIRKHTSKLLDVHLMISEPDRYLEAFRDAGADVLTIHYEACTHLHRTLGKIKELGMKAGVTINPHSPVSLLSEVASIADLILIMSVNPGFGGQKFIDTSFDRLRQARQMIDDTYSNCLLEVDGGVTLANASRLVAAGADILVAGNTIFSSPQPEDTIHALLVEAEKARNSKT